MMHPLTRRGYLFSAIAATFVPTGLWAQQDDPWFSAQWDLVFGTQADFLDALAMIERRGSTDMAAGLILALRFTRGPQAKIVDALERITGEALGDDWFDWMIWQESTPEIKPHPSYLEFKRKVFLRVDRNFEIFLKPEYLVPDQMKIRLEEITWGGVRKDGIPSLDAPMMLRAEQAAYLRQDDLVFGVSINSDARAYPLRIMGWHEMFNDVIGGVPVALAYCTLCGSGILFETDVSGRVEPFIFGSSGFLYRSNKLMFDRTTHSLWNQYTGKPVVGPLVDSGIELRQRPVVITTWAEWSEQNPETTVLSEETGYNRDYGSGVVYNDYFSSDDLMFPVTVDQTRNKQKDYVFGIRQFGANKAWPLKAFGEEPVINDTLGPTPLVLLGAPTRREVRAFERGSHSFRLTPTGLVDDQGQIWQVTEAALVGPGDQKLARIAGHISYWFAWNNYLGLNSEVYGQ